MTDTPMPHEIERLAGNAAYAARHGSSPKLNTAPPLTEDELLQRRERKMALSRHDRDLGYKQIPQPSPHVAAILRRIARGFLLVTNTTNENGEPVTLYSYKDGTVVKDIKARPLTPQAIHRMVREGWLIAVGGESLLADGPPQRYRARTLADGLLPKVIAPASGADRLTD